MNKPCCPRCKHKGYKQGAAPDGRPSFTCTACSHYWTCGHDGGIFKKGLK